ncbi:MAG: hypothetical protein H7175_27890 [Burkholderiales bacterium]|nr:hypothetical protein [Anaerolineae bacterium]
MLESLNTFVDSAIQICRNAGVPVTPASTAAPSAPTSVSEPTIRFSSSELGLRPVIGPVNIPTGTYRVTATTTGFIIVQLEPVSGSCEGGLLGLFNMMQGQGNDGAETMLVSENCQTLIQVSNTNEAWTLEFSRIDTLAPVPLDNHYDSTLNGLQAVIGPVSFLDGQYRVTANTDGFFIVQLQPLQGVCDTGFLGLFNLMQGQASSGAQSLFTSQGCVALITVENVTEPWTLDFERLAPPK